jgi:hypothetical protein
MLLFIDEADAFLCEYVHNLIFKHLSDHWFFFHR